MRAESARAHGVRPRCRREPLARGERGPPTQAACSSARCTRGWAGKVKWLISGGAALPRETQERFFALGLPLTQGYGLTEAAPVLTVARPGSRPESGVGSPVPGVEVRIRNADDKGVGEVVARGPNVMLGYTDGEATRATLDDDGWLDTGDVGRIDAKGRLELLGRTKDVVISPTGENVYPDDVEGRLGTVPHETGARDRGRRRARRRTSGLPCRPGAPRWSRRPQP